MRSHGWHELMRTNNSRKLTLSNTFPIFISVSRRWMRDGFLTHLVHAFLEIMRMWTVSLHRVNTCTGRVFFSLKKHPYTRRCSCTSPGMFALHHNVTSLLKSTRRIDMKFSFELRWHMCPELHDRLTRSRTWCVERLMESFFVREFMLIIES